MSKNTEKTYQIRFNTHSVDDSNRWRLISGEEEILVSEIYIDSQAFTTMDYMPNIDEYKWHISCKGNLIIKNNIAYITTEEKKYFLNIHPLKVGGYALFTWYVSNFLNASWLESSILAIGLLTYDSLISFLTKKHKKY